MARQNNRIFKYDSVMHIVDDDRAFQKWTGIKKMGDGYEFTANNHTTNGKRTAMREFIYYLHNERGMTEATPTSLIAHTLAFQKQKNQKKENASSVADFEALMFADDDEIGDFETIMKDYKNYVLKTHKPSAAKTAFLKTINFYKFWKVDISNVDTKINAPPNVKSKKAPDFKLLQKAFDKATDRDKCIISCGVTSGMARADITTLECGEFEDGLFQLTDEDGNSIIDNQGNSVEICRLQRNREKSDAPYHTFLAPETVRLIKAYLDDRNDQNQDETSYTMRRVYSPSDKIFIKLKFDDIDEVLPFKDSIVRDSNGKVTKYDESMRVLKPSAVTSMYYRLREQAKIPKVSGEYSTIRSHAMRHFFSNAYRKIDPDYKEHMMGHAGNQVKVTYENYNEEEGLEVYLQGLDGVTIQGDVNMITMTSPSVEKMKFENQELREENQEIRKQSEEALDRISTIENLVKDIKSSEKIERILNKRKEKLESEKHELVDKHINATQVIRQENEDSLNKKLENRK